MKFIELTCCSGLSKRLLLNIDNIASIYLGRRYNEEKKEYEHVTFIQETTSADNYWEVTETIDEVIALLRKQNEQVKLLDTALEIACDVYDSEMGIAKCPGLVTGGECVNGGSGCDHLDTPSASDCWKQEFIKAAEKHLRGEK